MAKERLSLIWLIHPIILMIIVMIFIWIIPKKDEITEMYSGVHDIIRSCEYNLNVDIFATPSDISRVEFSEVSNNCKIFIKRGTKHEMYRNVLKLLPYAVLKYKKRTSAYFTVYDTLLNAALDNGYYSIPL